MRKRKVQIPVIGTGGGGVTPSTILYGRQDGYSSGVLFDYHVNTSGSDTTGDGSLLNPYRTPTKAHAVAAAAGGNKKIALHGTGPYTDSVVCTTNGIEFHGYDTDQPKWYGSYTVTGFTQCVAGDATVVGSNYASIYKATFATSNLDSTVSFNSLIPLENGTPLNLVQLRHDTSDLYFQDAISDFYSSKLYGDSVTIAETATDLTTITHAAVLGNGTAPYTDAQLSNCSVMVHVQANKAQLVKVTSSGGVLTCAAGNGLQKEATDDNRYSLLNLLPALSVGQYGVKDNGDGTWTIYVWPNNPANLSSGLPIASKSNILMFSQCSNNKVSNIEFGHCAYSGTTVTLGALVLDRTTSADIRQNTVQYCGYKDFIGNAAIVVVGGTSNNIQYNTTKNIQNDFGFYFTKSSYTATGNRCLNNYAYRTSLTAFRFYGQTLVAVVDNKAENCGEGGHANKMNFYLGSDQVLAWRNVFINCGGYMTPQQSSRMLFGMNLCPADMTSDDDRAFVDQTGDIAPAVPTNPSNNGIINNAFPKPQGNTGTTNSLDASNASTSYTVNWEIANNVANGIDYSDVVSTPDYNVLTTGVAIGTHDTVETNSDNLFYDYSTGNWNTVPGSILTTKTGKDESTFISTWETWFPDINLRQTLNGYTWDPADPGVGPYGKHWPVQIDVTAPVLSSLSAPVTGTSASVTVTTNERAGTIYWVRYNGGTVPTGVQIVAGLDSAGNAALSSGTVSVTNPGTYGPWSVSGTSGQTDTLAVVHKDRSGNISTPVTASLAFASFSEVWTSMNGTNFPRKASALTGFQTTTRKVIAAITLSRSASQLTTLSSGGLIAANGSSDSVPTWTLGNTSKLQILQEKSDNTAFANVIVPPSTNMVADTHYLLLICFQSNGTNATLNATLWNVATGAQLGGTGTTGSVAGDISLVFKNNYDIFKGPATYERFMLWDNPSIASPDATDATLRGYFMSGGALRDPAIAATNLGTPLVSLSGSALAVASGATVTNAGSGGNFVMT
jgi:hypothetical protein